MPESEGVAPKTWREMLENGQRMHAEFTNQLLVAIEGQMAAQYGQGLLIEAAFCILSHDSLLEGGDADDKRASTIVRLLDLLKALDRAGCVAVSLDSRTMTRGGDA